MYKVQVKTSKGWRNLRYERTMPGVKNGMFRKESDAEFQVKILTRLGVNARSRKHN